MSCTRQDVIVLSVLCNLVVLALILASSNQAGSSGVEEIHGFPSQKAQRRVPVSEAQFGDSSEINSVSFDEIDQLLDDYVPAIEEPQEEVRVDKKESSIHQVVKKNKVKQGRYYTVQSGDNPWKIAKKYHLPYEKLLELNRLDEASAKNLKIGQKLLIEEAS